MEAHTDFKPTVVLPTEYEERLDQSQRIRQMGIMTLTQDGSKIPTSDEDRAFLLKLLDGADKVTLGAMRAKNDSNANANDEKIALQLALLAATVNTTNAPTPIGADIRDVPGVRIDRLTMDEEAVPGQLDQETHVLSFAELEAAHGRKD